MPDTPAAFILIGKTGAGKSSFIKLLGGKDVGSGQEPIVDDGIDSCTSTPSRYETTIEGRRIILLDTPGFDDSSKGNLVILGDIISHIRSLGQFCGFIFLHDISETRFSGSQRKTFSFLQLLCGDEWLRNVIVGTTMWNPLMLDQQKEREQKILKEHWDGIHKTIRLFYDDYNAAAQIITDLLALPPIRLPQEWAPQFSPETARGTGITKDTLMSKLKDLSFAEKLGLAIVTPIILAPAAVISAPVGVVAALVHLAKKVGA